MTPRSKTLPLVAFATVLMATLGLAFTLDNKNRRLRSVSGTSDTDANVAPIAAASDAEADVAPIAGTPEARKRTLPLSPLSGTALSGLDEEPSAVAATAPRAQRWRKTER